MRHSRTLSPQCSCNTEKLGNTGLFKGAYGGGWLKDPVVGTLGKLAHSAVSEAGEEFAEGLFDPVLRRFTYDEDASYDDDWFRETLYETAMGAVLGGIGGAVDVVTRKDGQTRIYLGKQINGHSVIVVLSSKGRKSVQPVTAWQNTTEHYLKKYGKMQIDTSQ